MLRGVVDFFNDTGGYGFIESDDVEEAVFFHMEDIGGPDLEEGTEVGFEVEHAEKGPRATTVRRNPPDPDDGGAADDTEVFEQGESSAGDDATHTQVYETAEPDSTGAVDGASPSYCPNCGEGLTAYPDPDFCPGCGTALTFEE